MNRALFALTNRTTFDSSVFPSAPDYQVIALDPTPADVHNVLNLDGGDYFVVGALAALRSFSELLENLGPDDATFDLTDWSRPLDTFTINLLPDPNGPASVRRVPTEFPPAFDIVVSYVDDNTVSVRCGSLSTLVPVTVTSNEYINLTWPAWAGITGALDLSVTNYGSGWTATIHHIPISYPYEAAAAALTNSRSANTLLLQTGLMAHFFRAKTGFEKVATVACALCLSNPSFQWPTFQ
jgi:hypothetical protein